MRNTTINYILEAAKKDPNIVLMTADLGYSVMEKFMEELPKQFINTGIAEQNMIGVAAGLALSGKKVFVYTIAPFATMRCFEQIRVDVCYQNLDVTIVGVGGGFAYGTLGTTHYALEDISIMRSLPNMKVMCPADPNEAISVVEKALQMGGPSYIRLNRGGEVNIVGSIDQKSIVVGDPIGITEGKNNTGVAVFSCGNILSEAHKAVGMLNEKGKVVSLFSFPFVKPVNKEILIDIIKKHKTIFTVEEHTVIGGFGSMIAEIIAEEDLGVKLVRLGVEDKYFDFVGKQDYMRDAAGISAEKIEKLILKNL
jgi:transketolase